MQQLERGVDTKLERELEKHFDLPAIRRVPPGQPFVWLMRGWRDLRQNPSESLAYGILTAIVGWVIWSYTWGKPQPFTTSITGFFLVAPLLAAGLYEISRRQERGLATSFGESLQGWRRHGGALAHFGLELVLIAIFWERLSAILFALLYGGEAPDLSAFVSQVFLSGAYQRFAIAYVLVGAVFAMVVFVITAVAIPMQLDRGADIYTAMATSFLAVMQNIPAMIVWAAVIVALSVIGFATLLIGLIVIYPLLGHATWHAYRDLTSAADAAENGA